MALMDLTDLVVAFMELSMAMLSSLIDARLSVSFARARTWAVKRELFEGQRTTEMPGYLLEWLVRFFIQLAVDLSHLSIERSQGAGIVKPF